MAADWRRTEHNGQVFEYVDAVPLGLTEDGDVAVNVTVCINDGELVTQRVVLKRDDVLAAYERDDAK